MKAEDAKKLTLRNQIKLEDCIKGIELQCSSGCNQIMWPNIGQETIQELMQLGYKITIHKDIISGFENIICSW